MKATRLMPKIVDLATKVTQTGRERTEPECRRLFESNPRFMRIMAWSAPISVIEAFPTKP